MHFFADDTTLLVRANDTADYEININKALTDIKNWTTNNNLNIYWSKISYIQFNSYQNNPVCFNINLIAIL